MASLDSSANLNYALPQFANAAGMLEGLQTVSGGTLD
jgi:hypothetical protein